MIREMAVVAGALIASVTGLGLFNAPPAHAGSGQFVRTQSGEIVCDVLYQGVYCQYPPGFRNAPLDPNTGQPFNIALVEMSGELKWQAAPDLVAWPDPEIGMQDGHAYHMYGWLIQAGADGTRFTSDFTGRGTFVSIHDVEPF